MRKKHKAIIWIWIATSIIAWSPVFSQNKDSIAANTNKILIEALDSTNRENLSKKFKRILEDNWEEKWLEIIQSHMLIWINEIRKNNSLDQLYLDENLSKAAQNYAIEMDNTWKFWHIWKDKSTPKTRAQVAWYKSDFIYENLWKDFFSIQKAIEWWMLLGTKTHKDNILRNNVSKIWVWYCNGYLVVMFAR